MLFALVVFWGWRAFVNDLKFNVCVLAVLVFVLFCVGLLFVDCFLRFACLFGL